MFGGEGRIGVLHCLLKWRCPQGFWGLEYNVAQVKFYRQHKLAQVGGQDPIYRCLQVFWLGSGGVGSNKSYSSFRSVFHVGGKDEVTPL